MVFLIALTACVTHSSAGQFVTDIDVRGRELAVSVCNVDFDVQHDFLNGRRSARFSVSDCATISLLLPATVPSVPSTAGGDP
jgi:hypothetical protein